MRTIITAFVVCMISAGILSGESNDKTKPENIDQIVASLRREGQSAVSRLAAEYTSKGRNLSAVRYVENQNLRDAERTDLEALTLLDQVCGQRFCIYSKLFWHTDFAEAQAQAQRENKPILTLVLLGDLREELSCANSRFFRTLLYPDPRISKLLREKFVLFWRKDRDVPTIEVSFPDGRKLKNTITGNSIHYVIDKRGRVVDALPGLYAPERFLAEVSKAGEEALKLGMLEDEIFVRDALSYHQTQARENGAEFSAKLQTLGINEEEVFRFRRTVEQLNMPPAVRASMLAMSKMRMESPFLSSMAFLRTPPLARLAESGLWEELSERYPPIFKISDESIQLITALRGKEIIEKNFWDSISRNLAADTVKNEFELRPIIRGWLISSKTPPKLESTNSLVYAMLFRMPAEDSSYGFVGLETFSALVRDGYHELSETTGTIEGNSVVK